MTAAIDKSTLMKLNYIQAKQIQYYDLPGLCLSGRATSKQVMIWSVNLGSADCVGPNLAWYSYLAWDSSQQTLLFCQSNRGIQIK